VNIFYVSIRATENYEFDKIRTAGVTGNSTNYKNSQGDNSICSTRQGGRQLGGQWCPPPFEIGAPPFHVWPPGCCIRYIQYCIFKMWPPLLFFCPSICFSPLLLNLGDGPATRHEISQPSRPISPRVATDAHGWLMKTEAYIRPINDKQKRVCCMTFTI